LKAKLLSQVFYITTVLNICVTNDHGYVPLVNTSRYFPHKDYGDKIGEVLFENNNLTISNKKHKKYVLSLWQWVNAYDIFMSIYLTNHQNSVLELIKKSLTVYIKIQRYGFF
jgi:hypothetical protein